MNSFFRKTFFRRQRPVRTILIFAIVSVVFPSLVSATGKTSFGAMPSRVDTVVGKGGEVDGELIFHNFTEKELILNLQTEFILDIGQDGEVRTYANNKQQSWLQLSQTKLVLPATRSKALPYKITVPAASEKMSQSLVLFASTDCEQPVSQANELCIRTRVGIPFFIAVDKPSSEDVVVDISDLKSLNFTTSSKFHVLVINTGGSFFYPRLTITLLDWRGREVTQKIIKPRYVVPSGKSRLIEAEVSHPEAFGFYRLRVSADIGEGSSVVIERKLKLFSRTEGLVASVILISSILGLFFLRRRQT